MKCGPYRPIRRKFVLIKCDELRIQEEKQAETVYFFFEGEKPKELKDVARVKLYDSLKLNSSITEMICVKIDKE